MKTKEEKKKSNLWFVLLVLLLISVILCISSFGIATWARYRNVVGNNVVAQIAKWSFKVNNEEEQFANINLADTIAFEHVETTKIAPGTYGSFDLDIDARGSEVSLDYYININVAEKPTNLKFYSDSTHTTLIPISADNKIYLDGEFLLSNATMQETRTIYWNWEYRTEEMPSSTVLQGYYGSIEGLEALVTEYNDNGTTAGRKQELALKINDKIDTYEQGGDVLLEVRVKGVQINPNFSLKRAQITSGKSQTYNVGDQVNLALEFTENVYGDNDGQSLVTNSNAPEVTLAFGGASANNPVAKVASLMSTNLKLSAGENVATFASVNGNKINYTYTIKSTDIGALRIANITGSVYNSAGKQINFGTVQSQATSIPEVVGGTISAQVALTPTPVSTPVVIPQSLSTANLGQYVDLGTNILDLNNLELSDGSYPAADWRVFNKTENGTWLILSSYLPYSKMPNITGLTKCGEEYFVNSDNKTTLVNALKNESEWKNLISNVSSLYNNPNVKVKGALEFNEWTSSWNSNAEYPKINSTTLYLNYDEPSYHDTLYFPNTNEECINCGHYWLATECGTGAYRISIFKDYGQVNWGPYTITGYGLRPVIFIPNTSLFTEQGNVLSIAQNQSQNSSSSNNSQSSSRVQLLNSSDDWNGFFLQGSGSSSYGRSNITNSSIEIETDDYWIEYVVRTKNLIDFSGYSKIVFEIEYITGVGQQYQTVFVGVTDEDIKWYQDDVDYYAHKHGIRNTEIVNNTTIEVDLTEMNIENGYIIITATDGAKTRITSVYME